MAPQPPPLPPASITANINERTTLSWPIVVVLGGIVFGGTGGFVRAEVNQQFMQREVDRGADDRRRLWAEVDVLKAQLASERARGDVAASTLARVEKMVESIDRNMRDAFQLRPARGTVP